MLWNWASQIRLSLTSEKQSDRTTNRNYWPNPGDSIGDDLGTMNGYFFWDIAGPASRAWTELKTELDRRLAHATFPSSVRWHCYMCGKTEDTAQPTVVFIGEKSSVKQAQRLGRDVILQTSYRGFRSTTMHRDPGLKNLVDVASAYESDRHSTTTTPTQPSLSFWRHKRTQSFMIVSSSAGKHAAGTLSGPLKIGNEAYFFTSAHVFNGISIFGTDRLHADDGNDDEHGLEFDPACDMREDYKADDDRQTLADITEQDTRRYHKSQNIADDMKYDEESLLSEDDELVLVQNDTRLGTFSSHTVTRTSTHPEVGDATFDNVEWPENKVHVMTGSEHLDYALIKLPQALLLADIVSAPVDFSSLQIPTRHDHAPQTTVSVHTANRHNLAGTFRRHHVSMCSAYSGHVPQLWTFLPAPFNSTSPYADHRIRQGDSGSFVYDTNDGTLYGHIIAGDLRSGSAYMVPVTDVVTDIKERFSLPLSASEDMSLRMNLPDVRWLGRRHHHVLEKPEAETSNVHNSSEAKQNARARASQTTDESLLFLNPRSSSPPEDTESSHQWTDLIKRSQLRMIARAYLRDQPKITEQHRNHTRLPDSRVNSLQAEHDLNLSSNSSVFWLAALGFLADSYTLFASNLVLPALATAYWDHDPGTVTGVEMASLVGSVLGRVGFGVAADIYGRRALYGVELMLVVIGTLGILQSSGVSYDPGISRSLRNDVPWLYLWRAIMGIATGAGYPLSACMAAEWVSKHNRSQRMSMVFLGQPVGQLLAYTVGVITIRHLGSSRADVDKFWRIVVGFGAVPTLIAIIARRWHPKEYWFSKLKDPISMQVTSEQVNKRSKDQAPSFAEQMHDAQHKELSDDNERGHPGSTHSTGFWLHVPPTTPATPQPTTQLRWEAFSQFLSRNWSSLIGVSLCWFLLDFAFYGMALNSPGTLTRLWDPVSTTDELDLAWWQSTSDSISAMPGSLANPRSDYRAMMLETMTNAIAASSLATVLGSGIFICAARMLTRRTVLIGSFFALSILLAVSAGTLSYLTDGTSTKQIGMISSWFILQLLFSLGPNTLIFLLPADIFPARYRSSAYGLTAASGTLGIIFVQAGIWSLPVGGMGPGMALLASFSCCMALGGAIALFLPTLPDVHIIMEDTNLESLVVGSDDTLFDSLTVLAVSRIQDRHEDQNPTTNHKNAHLHRSM